MEMILGRAKAEARTRILGAGPAPLLQHQLPPVLPAERRDLTSHLVLEPKQAVNILPFYVLFCCLVYFALCGAWPLGETLPLTADGRVFQTTWQEAA